MWKNLLNKGKCLVGLHQGEWTFPRDHDCTTVRVCTQCGVENQKIEHTWSGWDYVAELRCDQQRSCSRCQGTEPRVVHLWQDPVWRFPDRCDRMQMCSRCNAEKDAPAKHTWAEWEYLSPNNCTQAQRCERCGSMSNQQRTEHLWGEWQHSEVHGGAVRVCRRCGELTLPEQPQVTPSSTNASANHVNTARPPATVAQSNTLSPERAEKFKQLRSMLDQHSEMQNTMSKIFHTIHENAETTLTEIASKAAGSGSDACSQQPEQDTRLIGHWRFTDMTSGGGFSQTTDYHRMLKFDGTFSEWNHSCSSFGEQRSQPEAGRWRSASQNLYLQYDGSGEVVLEYYLENSSLFFPSATHQRLWERVR